MEESGIKSDTINLLREKHGRNDGANRNYMLVYVGYLVRGMLARGTGLFFAGGAVYFGLIRRAFTTRMSVGITGVLGLFLGQGLIGWWMVKSGFQERQEEYKVPRVSPYRLASHLMAATILYSALILAALAVLLPPSALHLTASSCAAALNSRKVAAFFLPLAPVTLASGAFVAGNDAGNAYNTWPKMLDRWVPEGYGEVFRNWRSIFENIGVVQFNHRMLAYTTIFGHAAWFFYVRRQPFSPLATVMLGIATLLSNVPIYLGVMHQAAALVLKVYTTLDLAKYVR